MSTGVPGTPCETACRAFDATAAAVPVARRWAREWLARAGVEQDVLSRVELLVTELTTNAVQHARGSQLLVQLTADQQVVGAVHDDDDTPPRRRRADLWDAGGRGLALVAALSDAWGCRPEGDGKWIWFRVARPAPGPAASPGAASAC